MAEYTIDKFTYDGNTYKLKSSTLKNLVDGSQTGSIRGISTVPESNDYTIGLGAVAIGQGTKASGNGALAEGGGTQATAMYSHAEGAGTQATGQNSHTEGGGTVASGLQSHAEGNATIANHSNQHVFGDYNIADDSTAAATARGNYVEIVGNGTSNARSNARTLDWSGNEILSGKLTLGTAGVNSMDAATVGQIPNVPAWALASTKPTYTASEVNAIPYRVYNSSGTGSPYAGVDTVRDSKLAGYDFFIYPSASKSSVFKFTTNYTTRVNQSELHYLIAPVSDTDAANKKYVDDSIGAISIPTKVSDLTNDAGYITGYTETDPVFISSAAYGITASDISNWNSKQAALVSGTNIKTINNESILGSGDITIQSGSSKNVWYGTCTSSASTDPKVITTDTGDFTLTEGNIVCVKFTNASGNLGNDATQINVDGTGATNIYRKSGDWGVNWPSGSTVAFIYNGTNFDALSKNAATSYYYGETILSSAIDSTSTTTAATSKAVSDLAAAIDTEFNNLATVASSGSYTDLTNKPSIPVVDSQLSAASTNAIQNKAVTEAYFTNAKNTWYGVGSFANDVLTVTTTQHTQYTTAFVAALGHTVRVLMTSNAEFTSTTTANVDGTGAYVIFNGEDGVVAAGDLITLTFENRYEQGNMYVVSYVSKKSGVTAGTYDGGFVKSTGIYIPTFTVDAKGHITAATDLGTLLPSIHDSNYDAQSSYGLVNYSYYIRTLREYNVAETFTLPADQTNATLTIYSDPGSAYPNKNYFRVMDLYAIDKSTNQPVLVDWTTSSRSSGGGSITISVSIAKAYGADIVLVPILSAYQSNTM